MTYDIIVGFSNGIVRGFNGITKIEYRESEDYDNEDYDSEDYDNEYYDNEDYDNEYYDDEDYDDEDYKWIEIENPLKFKFDSYGDYRFSSKSKNAFALTDNNCFIIFVEVTKSNSYKNKNENVK